MQALALRYLRCGANMPHLIASASGMFYSVLLIFCRNQIFHQIFERATIMGRKQEATIVDENTQSLYLCARWITTMSSELNCMSIAVT